MGDSKRIIISGKIIKGATGLKSTRLRKQVLLNVKIGDAHCTVIFIIVPKLVKDCIVGYDTQKALSMMIDTRRDQIMFTVRDVYFEVSYESIVVKPEEYNTLVIESEPELDDKDGYYKNESEYIDYDNEYSVTQKEIEEKINACENLKEEQRKKLKNLINKYKIVFEKRPGLITTYEHELLLTDTRPFVSKTYPVPINYREKVNKEIEKMLKFGVIRRSSSPYLNSIVVVIKKDGSIRLCLDARKLNEKLYDDHEAPPGVEEIFQQCKNLKVMSSLDLTSSYWQIPLNEDSKKDTAFRIDGKVYEFNVVAFGIKTSGAALLRGLDIAIHDLDGFLKSFVDDLLCMSKDFDEHMIHLEKIFQRFLKHNLRINFQKSKFFQLEVKFLGHVISPDGIKPDPEKIKSIKNFSCPRNVKELQSFLGFVNFYTKFVRKYSDLLVPLLNLLKKK